MTLESQVPILLGEAAKSYVELRWIQFYFEAVLVIVLIVLPIIFFWRIPKD
jgi:hypothetical protein